jgi:hypothetical protein
MRWEAAKIVIDWFAFFLVTTDLYGKENLERLSGKLQVPLVWTMNFLDVIFGFAPPFFGQFRGPTFVSKEQAQGWAKDWERWATTEEGTKWGATDKGKKSAEKVRLTADLGLGTFVVQSPPARDEPS